MLDPAFVRDNMDAVRAGLRNRGVEADAELEQLGALESRRRRLIPELEGLKRLQNTSGDEIARAKRQGHDASGIFAASKQRAAQIKQFEIELDSLEYRRSSVLLMLPNLAHASVPVGSSAADNREVRRWGDPPKFDFGPKAFHDLSRLAIRSVR